MLRNDLGRAFVGNDQFSILFCFLHSGKETNNLCLFDYRELKHNGGNQRIGPS